MSDGPDQTQTERIMVVIGSRTADEQLLRAARQASGSRGAWFAIYINQGERLTEAEHRQLTANLDLARSFGATVITTAGPDPVDVLLRVARQQNISRLLLGTDIPSSWWEYGRLGLQRARLLASSGNLDITFISLDPLRRQPRPFFPRVRFGWREWVRTSAILVGVTGLGVAAEQTLGYSSVPPLYLLSVIIASLFLSRWPVMLLAFGSTMAWWFFLLPQRYSLRIHRLEDALMLALFFVTALVSGHIASVLRARERGGLEGERTARTLYDLLRGLNENRDFESGGLESAIAKIENVFHCSAALLRPSPDGKNLAAHPAGKLSLSPSDLVLAAWSLLHRQWAGRLTDQFPDCPTTFVPLYSNGKPRGVLAVQLPEGETWETLQRELMESMTGLMAQMMERDENAQQAQVAGIAVESQKMQRALLDNFSHEMHTPISVLSSALQHLRQDQQIHPDARMLLQEACIAVDRLNLVVKDMTNLAQIECGTLRPALEWCESADFIQEWMDGKKGILAEQRARLSLPEQPVYIHIDPRLLITALDNLFYNALRHAPAGTAIEIRLTAHQDRLRIEIADQGPGIPPDQQERIFERFFRGPGEAPGGMGLGLPVARQFAELMGGCLGVHSQPGKGACFVMTFPCASKLSLAEKMNP